MQNADIKSIMVNVLKIFGIIGIIFCGIALAVPWAGFGYGGVGISFNAWGISSNIPTSSTYTVTTGDAFYISTITSGVTEGVVAGICMILVFVFTLITLFIGIMGLKRIQLKGNKTFLIAGIFAIITIILSVIAVSQINGYISKSIPSSSTISISMLIGYSYGFILMIIAMIFFFIVFGIQTFFIHSPVVAVSQQPMYQQQPPTQQAPTAQAPPSQPQIKPGKNFCPNCGNPIAPNVKFCSGCGKKV